MGISGINPRRRHIPTGMSYTLAARIPARLPAESRGRQDQGRRQEGRRQEEGRQDRAAKPAKINVIAIADLDLIGEQFFEMRRQKIENLDFDNVTFVLNCVDVLAGDESFVGLAEEAAQASHARRDRGSDQDCLTKSSRSRRRRPRTQASDELDPGPEGLRQGGRVRSGNRTDLDERTKEIQLANLQTVAQRRLDVKKQIIEDEKLNKIRESKAESERKIRGIQNQVRLRGRRDPSLAPADPGLFVVDSTRCGRENLGPTRSGWPESTAESPIPGNSRPMNELARP